MAWDGHNVALTPPPPIDPTTTNTTATGGGGKGLFSGQDSAQLGLDALAQTVRDPAAMTQAMELLNDPQVAAEVEAMMKDPAFQV